MLAITIDLAGHGDSDATRQDWTIASFGTDVRAVVDALSLEDVVLVGHSMGADVTLEASRGLEGRVSGMVWVDQYGQLDRFLDDRQVESRLEPFRSDFVAATHAFVRRLFSPTTAASLVDYVSTDMASAPQRIAIPCLEATWAHGRRIPELLAEMKLAVVAINSRDTDAASMKRHGVDVIAMSGVGHFPMLEDPEQFDRCLSRGIAHVSKGMLR